MKGHPENCQCPMCRCMAGKCDGECQHCGGNCHWCGGKHRIIRWVLGILILLFIFLVGVKFGELKSYMYGGGLGMGDYGYYPIHRSMMLNGYVYGPDMMNLWNKSQSPTSTTK